MRVDDTITNIFTTISKEVKEKYNVDYSIDQIHDIVNAQIEATKQGFVKGISVCWARFCKFVFTNKVNRRIEIINVLRTIDNEGVTSAEERIRIKKDIVLESARKKQALMKASNPNNSRPLGYTADKVLSVPNTSKAKIMVFKRLK